ncbi:hypothetical protein [Anabaena sp. UHCC 0399]|uniref:hypothetical protein n=1 Tax=Anabaena sp. UHCC 0399 TaxID=3110238 RepID=UPI002B21DE8F|nr:hypothetical protein [Anabaena sp. UHCC 0399]MEA5567240.1 hypothetical protein [Anabaena sp. UHCC 0399]
MLRQTIASDLLLDLSTEEQEFLVGGQFSTIAPQDQMPIMGLPQRDEEDCPCGDKGGYGQGMMMGQSGYERDGRGWKIQLRGRIYK